MYAEITFKKGNTEGIVEIDDVRGFTEAEQNAKRILREQYGLTRVRIMGVLLKGNKKTRRKGYE